MFYFIQLFAFGLLLGVPMKSAGLKCYYNNNGCDLLEIENNIKVIITCILVPMGETRDDPPVECQEQTRLDKPYCVWSIEGRTHFVIIITKEKKLPRASIY